MRFALLILLSLNAVSGRAQCINFDRDELESVFSQYFEGADAKSPLLKLKGLEATDICMVRGSQMLNADFYMLNRAYLSQLDQIWIDQTAGEPVRLFGQIVQLALLNSVLSNTTIPKEIGDDLGPNGVMFYAQNTLRRLLPELGHDPNILGYLSIDGEQNEIEKAKVSYLQPNGELKALAKVIFPQIIRSLEGKIKNDDQTGIGRFTPRRLPKCYKAGDHSNVLTPCKAS